MPPLFYLVDFDVRDSIVLESSVFEDRERFFFRAFDGV